MQDFFFYLFAALTLVPALSLVLSRNPVNCAMYLILSILGIAGLFVTLQSYFLAALQILVYAGAVVVLFLFIIMLLDVTEASKKKFPKWTLGFSVAGALVLAFGVYQFSVGEGSLPEVYLPADHTPVGSDPVAFGHSLFGHYMLPFQVAGYLLLIAMIGVIWLSKKSQRDQGEGKGSQS